MSVVNSARQPLSVSRRTFLKSSAAMLSLARLARAGNGFIRQPYLQRLLNDRVTILWTTAASAAGTVKVIAPDGSATSFNAVAKPFDPAVTGASSVYFQYHADLTGLAAGTPYQYQISMDGSILAADPVANSFVTPTAGDFSFLVLGDSGTDSEQQHTIIQRMLAEPNISKVIHLGDLAYSSGTFDEFERNYFRLYAPLMSRTPFFTTPGNHEYLTDSAAPYLAMHSAPESKVPAADEGRYYSFDRGDAHFVSLDSNLLALDASARMLAWLDADLGASQKYWKIVYLHHPPYPTGTHFDDPICALVRQEVNPIVERHGVQLVLAGHEHAYERSYPVRGDQPVDPSGPSTRYVITGGGGAGLATVGPLAQCALSLSTNNYLRVDMTGAALTVSAIGLDGAIVDRFVLNPPPALTPGGIVNAGDFSQNIAPGSLATIFGQNFALRGSSLRTLPLPNQLGSVSVTANGIPAPLIYVSAQQLNFQMPYTVSGQVTVRITTPNGSVAATVNVTPVAPSVLAVVAGSNVISAQNPAVQGQYMTLYCTGLGAPNGICATGEAVAGPMSVMSPVQVLFGDLALQPSYAGLAPGFAGLNQVNVRIPPSLPDGTYTLRVAAGQAMSVPMNVRVGGIAPLVANSRDADFRPVGEALNALYWCAGSGSGAREMA